MTIYFIELEKTGKIPSEWLRERIEREKLMFPNTSNSK